MTTRLRVLLSNLSFTVVGALALVWVLAGRNGGWEFAVFFVAMFVSAVLVLATTRHLARERHLDESRGHWAHLGWRDSETYSDGLRVRLLGSYLLSQALFITGAVVWFGDNGTATPAVTSHRMPAHARLRPTPL